MPPASSSTTRAPACVSACAAMPPPAPEPTMATSYTVLCCMPAPGLALQRREMSEAVPDRCQRIIRSVVLHEKVQQPRRFALREQRGKIDHARSDIDHLMLRRARGILQVQ